MKLITKLITKWLETGIAPRIKYGNDPMSDYMRLQYLGGHYNFGKTQDMYAGAIWVYYYKNTKTNVTLHAHKAYRIADFITTDLSREELEELIKQLELRGQSNETN